MAKRPAYKQEKRKKELNRLKKQEEKRQKRLNKAGSGDAAESMPAEGEPGAAEQSENSSVPQQ